MTDRKECEEEISVGEDRSSSSPTQTDVEELRKKLKPPDNKRFHRELDKLSVTIRQKEDKLRSYPKSWRSQADSATSIHVFKDRETLKTELRECKAEREKEIEIIKKIDQDLKAASGLVQSKTEDCAKLQAGLKYKKESKVDEAIKRLEHQLKQQLKLREEKRIVTEIDTLRRSKKYIHDFDALKNEIGQLRDNQHLQRSKRDVCTRAIARLKSREEQLKKALDEQRHKADEARNQQKECIIEQNVLKKEIDELYNQKRALVAGFNKEKDEYHNLLRDIRLQERQIKREVEVTRAEKHAQKSKQFMNTSERSSLVSKHEKMLTLCDTLMSYLEKMNIYACTKPSEAVSTFKEETPDIQGAAANFSGGTFLRKKSDDDLEGMYGGNYRKQGKRSSKKGKRSTQKENVTKKLVHHPLVLEQFVSLYISPPSTPADISKTLELLREKKEVLSTVLACPEISLGDSESSVMTSTEIFPSLPSQNSVEQETLSTTSSTDDRFIKDDNGKSLPTTESQNAAVAQNLGEQDKIQENDDTVATEGDLQSHLNGSQNSLVQTLEQSNSHNINNSIVDNGIEDGVSVPHKNEIQDDKKNLTLGNLAENHVNTVENLITKSDITKFSKDLEFSICEQNNAEYMSNGIRYCDSQEEGPKACSKEALPDKMNEQSDPERAIDCPA